jgi:hypothetical protein
MFSLNKADFRPSIGEVNIGIACVLLIQLTIEAYLLPKHHHHSGHHTFGYRTLAGLPDSSSI